MQTYNVVDLFSGAGGLSLGFMQTGRIKIVAAAENNPNARKTYKRNLKVPILYSDVRTINYQELLQIVGNVDIVIGGPPCQGFSNANRQHSTIISTNNRLVKEYVRAICELRPRMFVMENVAMLKSQVHRFFVDESDLHDERVMRLELNEDELEILPANLMFEGAEDFVKSSGVAGSYIWADSFYKIINLLYRYRINQPKFNTTLDKYRGRLEKKLPELLVFHSNNEGANILQEKDVAMAKHLLDYINGPNDFGAVIASIETPLMFQRALLKQKEIQDNNVHVFDYKVSAGALVAVVKSYAVSDYISCILQSEPYEYTLKPKVLNALYYGAPQRRERFILVGISKDISAPYETPEQLFNENFRTVRDAIADLEDVPASTSIDAKPIEIPPRNDLNPLATTLRGRLLYNHVATATTETALSRFKALKEGQNFHDLDPELKTTYSKADRTQNTIYMRLNYDEPSGTVVNVRKSMWIHPKLDRAISIREAARLQTFPDSFVFEGTKDSQYQQIGNAVPPILAKAIAQSVITVLDKDDKE